MEQNNKQMTVNLNDTVKQILIKGNPKDYVDKAVEIHALKKQEKAGEIYGVAAGQKLPDNWEKDGAEKIVERDGTVYLFKKFRGKWYRVTMTPENP